MRIRLWASVSTLLPGVMDALLHRCPGLLEEVPKPSLFPLVCLSPTSVTSALLWLGKQKAEHSEDTEPLGTRGKM